MRTLRPSRLPLQAGSDGPPFTDARINTSWMSLRLAAALCILLLTACGDKPVVVNTVSDTFCTRVERFHATEAERAALKANSGPLERVIRWVAGINAQWDEQCLRPAKGA